MQSVYFIDNDPIPLAFSGKVGTPSQGNLLQTEDDLTRFSDWAEVGYTILDWHVDAAKKLKDYLKAEVRDWLRVHKVAVPAEFEIENYHRLDVSDILHRQLARKLSNGYFVANAPCKPLLDQLTQTVSEAVHIHLTPFSKWVSARFHFRMVRPGSSTDFNPPHKDAWIPRLKNGLNLYVPLAGSSEKSALPLMPGSHRIPEFQVTRSFSGATINHRRYTVPVALLVNNEPVRMIRPNPDFGQVMVFSPYLIHGGGANYGNQTRVSLEMRLWRLT